MYLKVYLSVDLLPEPDLDGDVKSLKSLHHLAGEELEGSGLCASGEHHKCITLCLSCIKIKKVYFIWLFCLER